MPMTDVQIAAGEALAYNRMGGVTEDMVRDICHDHNVDMGEVLEEMGWGKDHYDFVS